MFKVYVLKSQRNGKRYIGYTSKNENVRLREHNNGSNQFTANNGPFILLYFERFNDKSEAIRRERFLKSGQGRKWLDYLHL